MQDFLQPLFGEDLDLSTVRIVIYAKTTSGLNTSVWVAGETIVYRCLNAEGCNDLSTEYGMKILAHELRHVWQSRTLPWWKQWWRFGFGIFKSLWYERRFYSHKQVWQELDAGEFQKGPATAYIHAHHADLVEFKTLR